MTLSIQVAKFKYQMHESGFTKFNAHQELPTIQNYLGTIILHVSLN